MRHLTPIDRAIASYCADWRIAEIAEPDVTAVNPETLDESTPADFRFSYIDISSVRCGRVVWDSVQTIRFADSPSRARRVVRPGDTLICTVRPLLGSHTFADWDGQNNYVCSTGFAVFRSTGTFHPILLKHLPFAEQVMRQLVAWQCGTNYPAVNERDIRRLRIPIPSPDEQASIARILDAVDTATERTQDAINRAKDLKHAFIQRFFCAALGETAYADRPTKELPEDWALVPMESLLAAEPKNGASPKASSNPPGTPTFSIAAVREGRVDLERSEYLKFAVVSPKVIEKFRVNQGDVLIVRGNANPDLVGKAGMIDRFPKDCIYPDITKRVVFRREGKHTVTPDYAVLTWNHSIVHNQVLRRAKTSNGTLKINSRDVKQIIIPVPNRAEQSVIVDLTKAVDAKIDSLNAILAAYEQLKRTLTHDLLTGKVRIPSSVIQEMVKS